MKPRFNHRCRIVWPVSVLVFVSKNGEHAADFKMVDVVVVEERDFCPSSGELVAVKI